MTIGSRYGNPPCPTCGGKTEVSKDNRAYRYNDDRTEVERNLVCTVCQTGFVSRRNNETEEDDLIEITRQPVVTEEILDGLRRQMIKKAIEERFKFGFDRFLEPLDMAETIRVLKGYMR